MGKPDQGSAAAEGDRRRRRGRPWRARERERPVREPQVELEAEGDHLSDLRVFMSSGIGCAMGSLKNSSPSLRCLRWPRKIGQVVKVYSSG